MGYSERFKDVKAEIYQKPEESFHTGFYYDSQLEDPYLSMSLHANSKYVGGKWITWPGDHLAPITGKGESGNYGVEPLARCIMTEDFMYSISNNWSDYNGGNPLEELWNTVKPHSPILTKGAENLQKAISSLSGKNMGSEAVSWITDMAAKGADVMGKLGLGLNDALIIQGTRFTYYNGTQLNFNNMEMKFIAFSDYVKQGDSWVFQNVEDYIDKLKLYAMGEYKPLSTNFDDHNINEFIKEYAGFQKAPGGFKMDTKNLDNCLFGTLRLNIGGMWAIENLILRNMTTVMSKVQMKDPENPGQTVPLYAEISLQLSPACMITDFSYDKIIHHKGVESIKASTAISYINKMDEIKNKIKEELKNV